MQNWGKQSELLKNNLLCYVIFYVVLNYVCLHHFAMGQLSEVNRAEAETCFLSMPINIQMLLLFFDD